MKNIKIVKYFILKILEDNKNGLRRNEIEKILFNNKEFFINRLKVLKVRIEKEVNKLKKVEYKEEFIKIYINKLNYYIDRIKRDNNFNYLNYLKEINFYIESTLLKDKFNSPISYVYRGISLDLTLLLINKELLLIKRGFYKLNKNHIYLDKLKIEKDKKEIFLLLDLIELLKRDVTPLEANIFYNIKDFKSNKNKNLLKDLLKDVKRFNKKLDNIYDKLNN